METTPKRKHRKFSLGQRVKANEKAAGDYEGREGIITDIRLGGRTIQYGVRFNHEEGKADEGYFDSWMLDPKRASKVELEEERHKIEGELSELRLQRIKTDVAIDEDNKVKWTSADELKLDEEIKRKEDRLEEIDETLKR